jgi:signal transduction histidine kinase
VFARDTVCPVKTMDAVLARARRVDQRAVDVIVAVILGVSSVAAEAASKHPEAVPLLAGLVCGTTVAWRRQAPVVTTVVAGTSAFVFNRTGGDPNSVVMPIAIVLNYYMLGRRSAAHWWTPVDLILIVLAIPLIALTPGDQTVGAVVSVGAFFVVLPFTMGKVIGRRSVQTQELRAEADRLTREQHERARQAASEERLRIARELHDVVAHSVSVMVIQTQAARLVAGQDPEAARKALRAVDSCGREALADMRRMIGVLHRGDLELAAPGLAQLNMLAERAGGSGLVVKLEVVGHSRKLPPALDLLAFRIVQEALTNAIKYASPASALVRVAFTPHALELEISDTGRGQDDGRETPGSSGHGIIGMQERLALYSGELRAGKRRGGGFEVRARIPLSEAISA